MPRYADYRSRTTEEAFDTLRVDALKALLRLLDQPVPPRKPEQVALLTQTMRRPERVRELYGQLDETSQAAVQEAAHDWQGQLDQYRFAAKYGQLPNFGKPGESHGNPAQPTLLLLFFPIFYSYELPTDLRDLLRTFVPEPRPMTAATVDELPASIGQTQYSWSSGQRHEHVEEIPLRIRETARDALHDLKALLRLVDMGEVRVSETTRRPSAAAVKAVAALLHGGDFFRAEDETENKWDPSSDLAIKAFAWPVILQAAGLAQRSGSKLQLSPAGRKATSKPAHEVLHAAWHKWMGTNLLDEFSRIETVKGQKGSLTAVVGRRTDVVDVLSQCPSGRWLAVNEFFRLLKVLADDFAVARHVGRLYFAERRYGSLEYDGRGSWALMEGRYALAFLFEYAATMGLIDVAYIPPARARRDYSDRWGTDDLSCISRYDGLLYFRINPLGAWCLGLARSYEPEEMTAVPVLKVLPNLDVVAADQPLTPADTLLLDRFAERTSPAVWHLSAGKILAAVEEGLTVAELSELLSTRNAGPLPQTVAVFLADLMERTGQLRDRGSARLIECASPAVAQLLANDRRLRNLVQLAGERQLVFRLADEIAVRRGLRDLGWVLPPEK